MNGKHYIGAKVQTVNNTRLYPAISKVILWVDDNNYYEAGTDGGFVIEQDCPYATQAMADNLLDALGGYQYQSITAEAAQVTPTAELGDGITVNGVYTQLAYKNVRFSTGAVVDVAAPGGTEVDHEYVQEGSQEREFDRKIAQTYSQISKTAEEIKLEVASTIDDLSASIDIQIDSITSTVAGQNGKITQIIQDVESITQEVRGLNGQIASIETYVDNITLSVSNSSTSSTISLKAGDITLSSGTINMSGLVTYAGLSSGTTTIDGGCIKTGTIDADRLNLTGAITFGDLSTSVQNDITGAYSKAEEAQTAVGDISDTVSGWSWHGTTYIDGTQIRAGTVTASTLQGGSVELLNSSGGTAGIMYLRSASSASYAVGIDSYGAMSLEASGTLHLSGDGAIIDLGDNYIGCGKTLRPAGDGSWDVGASGWRWGDIYAVNGTIQTSDRNDKYDICYDLSKYDKFFDLIQPASFKRRSGTSGRIHTGFVAQDFEDIFEDAEITDMDLAAFIKSPKTDEHGQVYDNEFNYGIRYDELLPIAIYRIKKIESRLAKLEGIS